MWAAQVLPKQACETLSNAPETRATRGRPADSAKYFHFLYVSRRQLMRLPCPTAFRVFTGNMTGAAAVFSEFILNKLVAGLWKVLDANC